jgi:hypothetical protein
VKLVQTMLVRDEVDVVGAQIAYHLDAGVDYVIATDHDSRDGTSDVLDAYAREGHLLRIPQSGPMFEREWRTHMARLAATEHGADWVIHTDADEFWMPRGGSMKDVLGAVPPDLGVVWALTCHFVPRPEVVPEFAERMTARVSMAAPLNDPTSPYRPHAKVAHRADPELQVRYGAHQVHSRLQPLTDWYVADALHFPFRSLDQYVRKSLRQAHGEWHLGQYVRAFHAHEQGRAKAVFRSLVVDDETLQRGREAGSLVVDTRLRDALRSSRDRLDDGPGRDRRPHEVEAAALREADIVRLARRIDDAATRVAALESRGRGLRVGAAA